MLQVRSVTMPSLQIKPRLCMNGAFTCVPNRITVKDPTFWLTNFFRIIFGTFRKANLNVCPIAFYGYSRSVGVYDIKTNDIIHTVISPCRYLPDYRIPYGTGICQALVNEIRQFCGERRAEKRNYSTNVSYAMPLGLTTQTEGRDL